MLEQCLHTVITASKNITSEIIVVDNGSAEKGVEDLQRLFPKVHFVRLEKNIGFAKANNLALQQARGSLVLLLNPDTLLPESTLQKCLTHLATNTNTGAVGVRMINGFGEFLPESKRAKPSLTTAFFKLTGLAKLFPSSGLFNRYALGHLAKEKIHEVEVLAGAFMMVRKNILDETGGFDPAFFMYGEDIDLSLRIGKAGYTIHYLGHLPVVHYKGQSSKSRSVHHTAVFFQAMQIFVLKHYRLGFLLVPFIQLFSWFTQLKKIVVKQNRTETVLNETRGLLLICEQQNESHLKALLTREQQDTTYQSTLSINNKNIQEISAAITQRPVKQILIRIPDMSMEDAVSLMEDHPGLFFRFVFAGSETLSFNN